MLFPARAQFHTGAERIHDYLPFLRDRDVALVVNQTSRVGDRHLVDTLLDHTIRIRCLFAPEHGIRGNHGAGEKVKSGLDPVTGIPVISLYGDHKKPTPNDLRGVGLVVFDIQDVGARFYTYISTLHYVMRACAELEIPVLVLDRPNPNGHIVDGPVLKPGFESFVGMDPIPVLHGLTVGEYAIMLNEEGWLGAGLRCNLEVMEMENYRHDMPYVLPVPPSPNLPNSLSIALYPSLCFFEGTSVSVGRGTGAPFQVFGSPFLMGDWDTSFRPVAMPGSAPHPPYEDRLCFGHSFRGKLYDTSFRMDRLDLSYLIRAYHASSEKQKFFNDFFEKLAGTDTLRRQILDGVPEKEIRESWENDLQAYRKMRSRYLLYP